jgi:DNA-binding NarL/FixJ family response regulator
MNRSKTCICVRSAIMAKGLTHYIQAFAPTTDVKIFKSAADLLSVKGLPNRVIFLDLQHMTGEPGIILEKIRDYYPSCVLIALSEQQINDRLLPFFDHIILHEEPEEAIVRKINLIYPPEVSEHSNFDNIQVISDRECEILKFVALGCTNKEISDKLNISVHTVITHRKNITFKLGIKTIAGLTVYAILKNIISAEEVKT